MIERCSGSNCIAFAQIATSVATTYSDTGLTGTTPYSYRVRATDAAGNSSAYSNTAGVMTSDNQPPTAPTNLTAAATSGTQVNLSWTPSTDNVGVTGYLVERCAVASCSTFAQIAAPIAASFGDTGLTPYTSYSYRVRATDAAENLSPYSVIASAMTPDDQPPTAPGSPNASAASSTQIDLSWTASTDNVGVTGYFIERCQSTGCSSFTQVAAQTATGFSDRGLMPSTSYSYRIRSTDAAGNLSAYSATAMATTSATPDTQPPTVPAGLTAIAISTTQNSLTWAASTDNVGVTAYHVARCSGASCTNFLQVATTSATNYTDLGLTPGTVYSYEVSASDAVGNASAYSTPVTATTISNPNIYTYDANGRLQTVTTSAGGIVTYTYDAAGHLINFSTSP